MHSCGCRDCHISCKVIIFPRKDLNSKVLATSARDLEDNSGVFDMNWWIFGQLSGCGEAGRCGVLYRGWSKELFPWCFPCCLRFSVLRTCQHWRTLATSSPTLERRQDLYVGRWYHLVNLYMGLYRRALSSKRIDEETHSRRSLMKTKNKRGSKDCSLGHAWCSIGSVTLLPLGQNLLGSSLKEVSNPRQLLASDTTEVQFKKYALMWYAIECLMPLKKIKEDCVYTVRIEKKR